MSVQIERMTAGYPGVSAVEDINMTVRQGDFLGIIGPNGAGKSTLFACMLGIKRDYQGSIRLAGRDAKSSRIPGEIGYVPQRPELDPAFPATVRDVVAMAAATREDKARIRAVLDQVRLGEVADRRIGDLSGGQLQRVFIAKALVTAPKILILDEPMTGIDASSTEMFYEMLQEINRGGITVVWSSHNMDAVRRLANRVACLDRTLFFHGEPDDFFENESLVKKYTESSMQCHMRDHHA